MKSKDTKQLKRYRVRNPKWASLHFSVGYSEKFDDLQPLSKFKSLALTSVNFYEMQVGACVGRFNAEIKHLVKRSRHLRRLHFPLAVLHKHRFTDLSRWISEQKYLTDLTLVPYCFITEDEVDIADWEEKDFDTAGVAKLIHLLHAK